MKPGNYCFILIISSIASACSNPMAQIPGTGTSAACKIINSEIDSLIKSYALNSAEGEAGDRSAVQQSARLIQNSNKLLMIQVNLQLMDQNGCPSRSQPINPDKLLLPAMKCYEYMIKLSFADKKKEAELSEAAKKKCDLKQWIVDEG